MGGCCEVPPMLWPGIQPIPLPWAQGGRLHLGHRHRERVMGRAARSIPTPTFERIGGLHPSCGHSPAPPVVPSPRVPHPGADCPRRAASPLLVPREGGTGSPFPSGLAPLKAGTSPLSPPAQTPRRGERAVLSPHGDTFPALPPAPSPARTAGDPLQPQHVVGPDERLSAQLLLGPGRRRPGPAALLHLHGPAAAAGVSGPGPAARRRTGRGIAITAPGPPPAGSTARRRGRGSGRGREGKPPPICSQGFRVKPCCWRRVGSPRLQVRWGQTPHLAQGHPPQAASERYTMEELELAKSSQGLCIHEWDGLQELPPRPCEIFLAP